MGLLTADEVTLAGGYDLNNSGYYLYTGNIYWTLSPYYHDDSLPYERVVNLIGSIFNAEGYVYRPLGVRPVLNLKSDSLKNGSGTANDPYMV